MAKINRLQQILKLKERFYKALPGNESLLKLLSEAEIGEHVYNSNAIENSTLSLDDTEKLLMQIDLDRFVSEREIFEAKNLSKVMEYVDANAKQKELDSNMILFLHKILISNIADEIAGRYRKLGENVRGGPHVAPVAQEINSRIMFMFAEYYGDTTNNIYKKIAKFHLNFEYTHPFCDGNGRIGRVLNNYLLTREDYVPINIKFLDRQKYYAAFSEFQNFGKTQIMEEIVMLAILNSYHKRLAYLEHKKIINLADYAKQKKLSHSNLLNKANRQTIEAFTEKGVWKIGI